MLLNKQNLGSSHSFNLFFAYWLAFIFHSFYSFFLPMSVYWFRFSELHFLSFFLVSYILSMIYLFIFWLLACFHISFIFVFPSFLWVYLLHFSELHFHSFFLSFFFSFHFALWLCFLSLNYTFFLFSPLIFLPSYQINISIPDLLSFSPIRILSFPAKPMFIIESNEQLKRYANHTNIIRSPKLFLYSPHYTRFKIFCRFFF